tara:strand:+ start:16021 stop:16464 length:444 start_codon:yes stop_codon:yes gene_type:complete
VKPDINIALLNAAQEIINRFSPLIEDEYERSRLGSWGALILISAMKLNDASSALKKENEQIVEWLQKNSGLTEEDVTNQRFFEEGKNLDSYDQDNQKLRDLLDKEIQKIEEIEDRELMRQVIGLMRSMHQRRKVSDLIGLLQQEEVN